MTVFARLILKQRIILDAGWSLSESTIAHYSGIESAWKIIKAWIIDFCAFHVATRIVLESEQQVAYVSRRFIVPRKKLFSVYTGINEKEFLFSDHQPIDVSENSRLQVLFRGKYNSEAGIEQIATASQILTGEQIDFVIHTNSKLSNLNFSSNTRVVSEFLSTKEMTELYQNADVCLGQFSKNNRLKRTIPHKFFESLYFSKCYVTPFSEPIDSLIGITKGVYFTNGSDPKVIADALIELQANRKLVKNLGENGHLRYLETMTQDQLARDFTTICFS